jgi:hypothetical protein
VFEFVSKANYFLIARLEALKVCLERRKFVWKWTRRKFGSEGILAPVSASSAAAATDKSAFRQARRVQSIWSQVVGQLLNRKQFINCEDIRCHLVEFDV